jgi:hypothetical protein
MKNDRPQHDHPMAFVIAQQYSSVPFPSSLFHSGNEKIGAVLKVFLFQIKNYFRIYL